MPVSESTKRVLARLKAGRVISVVSAPTRRLADARVLILLSQMIYWTTRDKNVLQAGGWFSKSAKDWIAETGLTRCYVTSSIVKLRQRKVLKVWQRSSKTAPWFKLELQQLYALCQGAPTEAVVDLSQFIGDAAYRETITGRALPYYTLLADIAGDALLGFFLSRCVYWQESLEQRNRLTALKPTWGWSAADWGNDIGVSRTQLRTLLTQASQLGLIEVTEADRPFPGIWVKFEELYKAITIPVCGWPVHTVDQPTIDTLAASPPAGGAPENNRVLAQSDQESVKFAHSDNEYEQSTRARGVDCEDYTTTTTAHANSQGDVVVVVPADAERQNPDALIFPSAISDQELCGITRTISSALPHRRQALLDELGERLRRKQPKNPISYLRSLVSADNKANGELILELAHIAQTRREREVELDRLRNRPVVASPTATPALPPINAEESRKRLERAKAALKGRPIEETTA